MSRHIFETAKESGLPASAPQYSKWLQNPWWLLVRYVLWWSIFILKIGDHIDSHMLSYVTIHYIHRFMMKLSLKWIIIICYISLIYLIYIYIYIYISIYLTCFLLDSRRFLDLPFRGHLQYPTETLCHAPRWPERFGHVGGRSSRFLILGMKWTSRFNVNKIIFYT